jgi:hypothetical protein
MSAPSLHQACIQSVKSQQRRSAPTPRDSPQQLITIQNHLHPSLFPKPPSSLHNPSLSPSIKMVAYGDPLCNIKVWKQKSPYFIKASSPESRKYPGFNPRSVEIPEGLSIEYDIAVTLRDGVKMYVDIYPPVKSTEKIPIVIAWTPVNTPRLFCPVNRSLVRICFFS